MIVAIYGKSPQEINQLVRSGKSPFKTWKQLEKYIIWSLVNDTPEEIS